MQGIRLHYFDFKDFALKNRASVIRATLIHEDGHLAAESNSKHYLAFSCPKLALFGVLVLEIGLLVQISMAIRAYQYALVKLFQQIFP